MATRSYRAAGESDDVGGFIGVFRVPETPIQHPALDAIPAPMVPDGNLMSGQPLLQVKGFTVATVGLARPVGAVRQLDANFKGRIQLDEPQTVRMLEFKKY